LFLQSTVCVFNIFAPPKSYIAQITDEPVLDQYPSSEQWLKVVGLPSASIEVND